MTPPNVLKVKQAAVGDLGFKPRSVQKQSSGPSRYKALAGVSNPLMSLGHTGRRVVLGHTLNTQTLMKTYQRKKKVLSKFMISCWATFIAILGRLWPAGCRLDIPA